ALSASSNYTFQIHGNQDLTANFFYALPVITNQPQVQVVTEGTAGSFSVGSSGAQPLGYQWWFNGTNLVDGGQISGSQSNVLTITGAGTNSVGNYYTIVSNSFGMATSAVAALILKPAVTWTNPAAITYGQALGTAQLDASANVAGGFAYNPPLGMVLNAGSQSLAVTFTPTDTVHFTNATAGVSLTVGQAPLTVTGNNASRAYGQNNPAFSGVVTGLTNGDNISATFSCSAVSYSPPGGYPIVPSFSDPGGRLGNYAVAINDGTLTVTPGAPPTLAAAAPIKGLTNGGTSVTLTGSGFELGAGVLFGGEPAAGVSVNSGSQIVAVTPSAPLGTVSVTVTNPDTTVAILTNAFTFTGPPPAIQSQPSSLVVKQGSNAVFQVGVLYATSYQWQMNGGNLVDNGRITGTGTATLTISNAQVSDAGGYQVVMTNAYGSATSMAATLSVVVPPAITASPQSESVGKGGTATFTVGVSGTAQFSYQWLKGGSPLAGATGAVLNLTNVQTGDQGQYSVTVSNFAGTATSAPATLTVLDYCANAQPGQAIYPMGSVVPLTISTVNCTSQTPLPGQSVVVWISTAGTVRSLPATTDNSGLATVNFVPLATEAGFYQVAAALPGIPVPAAQGSFTLVGMSLGATNLASGLVPSLPQTNIITLSNLTGVSLTGINAAVSGATPDVQVQLSAPGTLGGRATNQLTCVLTAPANAAAHDQFQIVITSAQGTTNVLTVNATVVPSYPQLAATPSSLNAAMVQGAQTLVSFSAANTGGASTGPVGVLMPQAPWLGLVTAQTMPSLGSGQSATVTLALTPPSNLPVGPYSGSLILTLSNSYVVVPFTFNCISAARGSLQVTVQDELSIFGTGTPNVSNATVTVTDFLTHTNIRSAVTDGSGVVQFTNLASAYCTISVSAADHQSLNTTVLAPGGDTTNVTAF